MRSLAMGKLSGFFEGRLVFLKSIFVLLSMFMMALMLSQQFRDWFFSNTVDVYLNVALKGTYSSSQTVIYANDTQKNTVKTLVASFNVTSIDDIPTACSFPHVNIYEPSVVKIAGMDKRTLRCNGTYLPDLTYITAGNKLTVNTSKVKLHVTNGRFHHCRYKNISRHATDDNDYTYSDWSKPFHDTIELSNSTEFIKVECTANNSTVVSKNFYYLIPKKEEFDEIYFLNIKKRQVLYAPKETLNVIMIGMDTLMRNQLIRGCNKTYSYLMSTLKSFDLSLHSQVGSNSFANFVPLFTGEPLEEVQKWWDYKYHLDTLDMLTENFKAAGYRTLFTEDLPSGGCFHYLTKGFMKPFTAYNIRPLTLAMYSDKYIWKHSASCAGNQEEVNFQLGYLNRFLDTFADKPVFALVMLTKPTHDFPMDAKMFDEHLFNFYQSLAEEGHLNRSLLVSFSDHGVRFGALRDTVNAHVEGKTPYTILTFPEWFMNKYPDVMANMKTNTKRLTSHYDTRATLLDLLYFKSKTPPPLPPLKRGMSLFEKIPWDRTCTDAHIPLDYCLCGYNGFQEIDQKSNISLKLSSYVIEALNSKADKRMCAVYTLSQIKSTLMISQKGDNHKTANDTIVYQIKLEVKPGDAMFEANVYSQTNSTEMKVGNEIDRINMYKGTADCISVPSSKPFCYCNNLLP